MKLLTCSVALIGAIGLASAVAATPTVRAHRAEAAPAHRMVRISHRRRTSPAAHGHIIRAHMSAAAAAATPRPTRVSLGQEDTGLSETPSWFKEKDKAGYGWRDGGAETMVGVYRRPDQPDLPAPRIRPDSAGAAGVSLSFKLGGGH